MSREVLITTPENIALEYELAGLGTRFVANAVDTLLQVLLIGALVLVFFLIGFGVISLSVWAHHPAIAAFLRHLAEFATAGLIILVFVIFWGYYIYFELRWNGQTPGKRLMGLRVMREGGYPVNAYGAAARNLLRVVDFLPIFPVLGVICVMCTSNYQRLGDLVGGTIVVKQRAPQSLARILHAAQILPEHLDLRRLPS